MKDGTKRIIFLLSAFLIVAAFGATTTFDVLTATKLGIGDSTPDASVQVGSVTPPSIGQTWQGYFYSTASLSRVGIEASTSNAGIEFIEAGSRKFLFGVSGGTFIIYDIGGGSGQVLSVAAASGVVEMTNAKINNALKDKDGDNGTSGQILSSTSTQTNWISIPGTVNLATYASGTAYTMTASDAKVDFGTTDPNITITSAGTYLLMGDGVAKYNAATYAGAQTITLHFRRTNNTAADIANGTNTIELPVLTTYTGGDQIQIPSVIYATSNTNDVIEIFGSVSATPAAGSVTVDKAHIIAIKLF